MGEGLSLAIGLGGVGMAVGEGVGGEGREDWKSKEELGGQRLDGVLA